MDVKGSQNLLWGMKYHFSARRLLRSSGAPPNLQLIVSQASVNQDTNHLWPGSSQSVVAMASSDASQAVADGIVTFDVGGEQFKVLEQSIRAKPETLLCTLLDDPERSDLGKPIFVNGDAKRFRYILDWYLGKRNQERKGHINLREIPETLAGCPWDIRRDKQGCIGRCPRDSLSSSLQKRTEKGIFAVSQRFSEYLCVALIC